MPTTTPSHLRTGDDTLLRVEDLVVEFKTKHGTVHAVSDVSFDVRAGETLGVVGESGSGKSTIAKAIIRLNSPRAGKIWFGSKDLLSLNDGEMRAERRRLQMIFQDPIASLNPRRRVRDIVAEGLTIWPEQVQKSTTDDVEAIMRDVGLNPDTVATRRPSEFSGGQCQRIAIARALALRPELVICDEPVSALDVSVQAQILNLLRRMKAEHDLTLVFVSHDLAVIRNICDRVMVVYLGKIAEIGTTESIFGRPAHPYTQLLMESVPRTHSATNTTTQAPRTQTEMPSPLDPPSGCRFRTRCPLATKICADEEPVLRSVSPGHFTACHHAEKALQQAELVAVP